MIEDIAEINATTVQTMAVYESFENNDRTMTMNLDEDTDKGGENARRLRYSRFYLFFCGTRNLSRKEEIMLMKILPLSILAIIILISFIAVLTQVLLFTYFF